MPSNQNHSSQQGATIQKSFLAKHASEIAIAALIVLIAAGVFAFTHNLFSSAGASSQGPYAVIQSAAGERFIAPLNEDADFSLVSSEGENHVVIREGKVRMDKADCKNQICVNTKAVNFVGDTIMCLPHKVVVEIVAAPEDASPLSGIIG